MEKLCSKFGEDRSINHTRISSTVARTLISCSYLGMNWKYACWTSDIGH